MCLKKYYVTSYTSLTLINLNLALVQIHFLRLVMMKQSLHL